MLFLMGMADEDMALQSRLTGANQRLTQTMETTSAIDDDVDPAIRTHLDT